MEVKKPRDVRLGNGKSETGRVDGWIKKIAGCWRKSRRCTITCREIRDVNLIVF